MAGNSNGAARTVRVVYEIDAEGALEAQQRMDAALGQTSEALDEQASEVAGLETRWETANRAFAQGAQGAQANTSAQQLLHHQTQALAAGLSGLASVIGTDTDAGALVGRMGHMASMGLQLGSIFGPQGAIIGGLTGAVIPALESLATAIDAAVSDEERLTLTIDAQATAYDDLLQSIRAVNHERAQQSALSMGLGSLEEQQAAVEVQENTLANLRETARVLNEMAASEQNLRALQAVDESRRLTERRLAAAREALALAEQDQALEAADFMATGEMAGRASERRRGGRSGGRGRAAEDPRFALARGRGGDDAIAFALGLGDDGRPSDFDVELAGRQRPGGPGSGLRQGAAMRAEEQALERLADKRKEEHEAQLERIQAEVDAWTAAGEKIGSTLYGAFTTAVSGQESFDVAMVKGFKSLAIQFGGQMVNEGIAALLTAVGNTVANPPMAATKAAEGAGKLALGIGLGAAGAAIPVPSSGGSTQAPTPRLGPASGDGAVGGSVIVNMNAPAVVTGSRAAVGREIGGALIDARNRFGRV